MRRLGMVLLACSLSTQLRAEALCPGSDEVNRLVEAYLPGLALALYSQESNPCPYIASADFNQDGKADYAVILREKTAPRTYITGKPWYSTYVTVLLSAQLPAADYKAVILPGYTGRPGQYIISVERPAEVPIVKVREVGVADSDYVFSVSGLGLLQHVSVE